MDIFWCDIGFCSTVCPRLRSHDISRMLRPLMRFSLIEYCLSCDRGITAKYEVENYCAIHIHIACLHQHTWQRAKRKRINTEGKRIKTKGTSLHFWEPCQICLHLITLPLCICKRDSFFLLSFGFMLTCSICLGLLCNILKFAFF